MSTIMSEECDSTQAGKGQSLSQLSISITHSLPSLSLAHSTEDSNNSISMSMSIVSQQLNTKSDKKTEEKSPPATHNPLGIVYDTEQFTQFDEIYKYKLSTKKPPPRSSNNNNNNGRGQRIVRIRNKKDVKLCFKERLVESRDELRLYVNELKALRKLYAAQQQQEQQYSQYSHSCSSVQQMSCLYVNAPKGCLKFPQRVRLVMKFVDGIDLDEHIIDDDGYVGFLFEDDFRAIVRKILQQLVVIHELGILHCDLKPGNIRVKELSELYAEDDAEYFDVHIIDFGFSHLLTPKEKTKQKIKLSVIKGTPGFMAPETIEKKEYSTKSDMFSLGCMAFFLLTGKRAVQQSAAMDSNAMLPDAARILQLLQYENERNRDENSKIHSKTVEFVRSCLKKNPAHRPSAAQALNSVIFK